MVDDAVGDVGQDAELGKPGPPGAPEVVDRAQALDFAVRQESLHELRIDVGDGVRVKCGDPESVREDVRPLEATPLVPVEYGERQIGQEDAMVTLRLGFGQVPPGPFPESAPGHRGDFRATLNREDQEQDRANRLIQTYTAENETLEEDPIPVLLELAAMKASNRSVAHGPINRRHLRRCTVQVPSATFRG